LRPRGAGDGGPASEPGCEADQRRAVDSVGVRWRSIGIGLPAPAFHGRLCESMLNYVFVRSLQFYQP
jgi:hypothetical protein